MSRARWSKGKMVCAENDARGEGEGDAEGSVREGVAGGGRGGRDRRWSEGGGD